MRKLILPLIAFVFVGLAFLYFLIGGLLVWWGVVTPGSYGAIGGFVGALASILGLGSFFRPSITQDDVRRLGSESLRELAINADQIDMLEQRRNAQEAELATLEQQREELRVLVRRASTSLLLKDRVKHHTDRIRALLKDQDELQKSIRELHQTTKLLSDLEEEIKVDPHAELIYSIINSEERRSRNRWLLDAGPIGAGILTAELIADRLLRRDR